MTKRVLTIGEILVEIVATTKGDGFHEAQPLLGPFPSGAPAIFVDQAARMGAGAAIISRVGRDDFGQLNLDRLTTDGVDVSGIQIAEDGAPTGSAFVRYREDGTRRFVFNIAHSASGRVELDDATRALVARCDHLHVMGTALTAPGLRDAIAEATATIKAGGGTLSFDPNLRPEVLDAPGLRQRFEEVLDLADLFLPSGDEVSLFSDHGDEARAIEDLLARGVPEIVIKRGSRGASYVSRETRIDVAPLIVDEVDPTGAGDCFGGTFVALWLQGRPPAEALRLANAAGAHAVTRLGPMEGAAWPADLDRLLAAQEG